MAGLGRVPGEDGSNRRLDATDRHPVLERLEIKAGGAWVVLGSQAGERLEMLLGMNG